jgi:hypothetical protein
MSEIEIETLKKENEKLKSILRQCLKARQINHVKQIIKEALSNERGD